MRPGLPSLLLSLAVLVGVQARAQSPDAAASAPSAQLRLGARQLLATGKPDDAAKAADMLVKASEIDAHDAATLKARAETRKLAEPAPSESGWKVLVDVTPFLSFVIVALGFFVNNAQARKAEREKHAEAERQRQSDAEKAAREQQAAEEERWSHAMALIQKSEDFSPAAAILSTFQNGSHAALARSTAAAVMLNAKKFSNFSDLFNTFMEPVTRENLPQVLSLLRQVSIELTPLLRKAWKDGRDESARLSPADADAYARLTRERTFLGARVATVLRQPRRPEDVVDLADIGLDTIDLSGADLRGCGAPVTWNFVNLDGADLRDMRNISNTWPYYTAWWHASHIDAALLELLIERAPYEAGMTTNSPRGVSADGYAADVARLRAQAAAAASAGLPAAGAGAAH